MSLNYTNYQKMSITNCPPKLMTQKPPDQFSVRVVSVAAARIYVRLKATYISFTKSAMA